MAHASLYPPTLERALECIQGGRDKRSRPVDNNTHVHLTDDGSAAIKLHATDVVTYLPDGGVRLNTGGWRTVTTKDRINKFAPVRVWSDKGVWYVKHNLDAWDDPHPLFMDGIEWHPDTGWDADPKAAKRVEADLKLKARIAKFTASFRLKEGWRRSTGGDCFFCQMRPVDGKPFPRSTERDHLTTHLSERYYMASTLLNAAAAAHYGNPGFAVGSLFVEPHRTDFEPGTYRHDNWSATDAKRAGTLTSTGRRALRRYLSKALLEVTATS